MPKGLVGLSWPRRRRARVAVVVDDDA